MREKSRLTLGLIIVLVIAIAGTEPMTFAHNLSVANPYFNRKIDSSNWYWQTLDAGTTSPERSWDTSEDAEQLNTSGSAKIFNADSGRGYFRQGDLPQHGQEEIPVIEGITYNFSMYTKTDNVSADSSVFLNIIFKNSSDNVIDEYNNIVVDTEKGTHDWMRFDGTIKAPQNAVKLRIDARYYGGENNSNGTVWFDNITVETEGLKNGDFEENIISSTSPDYWTDITGDAPVYNLNLYDFESNWTYLRGSGTPSDYNMTYDTVEKVNGARSIRYLNINCEENNNNYLMRMNVSSSDYVDVKPETEYVISFWVKTDNFVRLDPTNNASGAYIDMMEVKADGYIRPDNITLLVVPEGTTDWTKISVNYTTDPGAEYLRLDPRFRNAMGTVWFDTISVELAGREAVDTATAYSGNKSLKIAGNGDETIWESEAIEVVEGLDYLYQGYIMPDSTLTGEAGMTFCFMDVDGNDVGSSVNSGTISSENTGWNDVNGTATIPVGAKQMTVRLSVTGTGFANFDDIDFIEPELEVANITIKGLQEISIPNTGANEAEYIEIVKDQFGAEMKNSNIVWSVANGLEGVSINSITGELSVQSNALPGQIDVIAESASDPSVQESYAVTLTRDMDYYIEQTLPIVTVRKNTDKEVVSPILIMALYTSDSSLIEVKMFDVNSNLNVGETQMFTEQFENLTDGNTVKTFVWDSCNLMRPLSGSVTSKARGFLHPGLLHNMDDLNLMKEMVVLDKQPWETGWEDLQSTHVASLSWQPNPWEIVNRDAYNTNDYGATHMTRDAQAAYAQALQWVITDDIAYAQKSIEILNAWSGTLLEITGQDAQLLAGITGSKFLNAAEIIRYTNTGWNEEDIAMFEEMMLNIFYPLIENFRPHSNGNWDTSMINTMMGIGVFCNRRDIFNKAVDYFYTGEGNGAITNYIFPTGQCQESGRDQAHVQLGLGYLVSACEIGWKQGLDMYGAYGNRLAIGYEYTAKYNLGFDDLPYEPVHTPVYYPNISPISRGAFRMVYERVYNHYKNRKGMDMPYTEAVINKIAPEFYQIDHETWGTLTAATVEREMPDKFSYGYDEMDVSARQITLFSPYYWSNSPHYGYTGTGYAMMRKGNFLQWNVNMPSTANRQIAFRYANPGSLDGPMRIIINGDTIIENFAFEPTGSTADYIKKSIITQLNQGNNTIRIEMMDLNDGLNPSIQFDKMDINDIAVTEPILEYPNGQPVRIVSAEDNIVVKSTITNITNGPISVKLVIEVYSTNDELKEIANGQNYSINEGSSMDLSTQIDVPADVNHGYIKAFLFNGTSQNLIGEVIRF